MAPPERAPGRRLPNENLASFVPYLASSTQTSNYPTFTIGRASSTIEPAGHQVKVLPGHKPRLRVKLFRAGICPRHFQVHRTHAQLHHFGLDGLQSLAAKTLRTRGRRYKELVQKSIAATELDGVAKTGCYISCSLASIQDQPDPTQAGVGQQRSHRSRAFN